MKKKLLVITLVGLFLMSLTGSAFAWSGSASVEGQPDQFQMSRANGYYIWQDEHGFHVWTTTRGEEHVFSGAIRTDGKFVNVRGHRLEQGDSLKVDSDVQGRPWFLSSDNNRKHLFFGGREVNYENDKIHFRFDTNGGSDGVNFHIEDASYLEFDLFIDGHPIPRREIHISDDGWHPQSHKFRLNQ